METYTSYDDQQLWAEIKSDNYPAFDELINRYWKLLYNSAYKRVSCRDTSQDLVQDVFLNIWLKRASLNIQQPEAYLKTAIRYRVYSHFTRNKIPEEFIELFENITDPSLRAENQLKYKELQQLVRAWIDTLPAKRGKIFQLYLEENLSTKEIARKLHITQKTVQNQLNRSFGALRTRISSSFSVLLLFL